MRTAVALGVAFVAFIIGIAFGFGAGTGGSTTSTVTATSTMTVTGATSQSTPSSAQIGSNLLSYSGSGSSNSQPFKATTSVVRVTLNVTSTATDPSMTGVAWFIMPVNGGAYVATGEVNGKSGSSVAYGYNLISGQTYYLEVISANAQWAITVAEVK